MIIKPKTAYTKNYIGIETIPIKKQMASEGINIPIIRDASIFTGHYVPSQILHRDNEIKALSFRMNRPLSGQEVKSTLIQGMSGTGKTLITRYVAQQLSKLTKDVLVCYIRLRGATTEYKAINKISQALTNTEYPGHTSVYIYNRIFEHIKQSHHKYTVFIFDEVDGIEKGYDNFLDAFLRPYENYNLEDKYVSAIYISNNTKFPQDLPVGTRSSWDCIDKLTFERYNAIQLKDILTERANRGLYDGTYNESVIPLCAALGAQEHGDARRTIELLGKSAELAQNEGAHIIEETHVKKAWNHIEYDRPAQQINALPLQNKAIVLAIVIDTETRLKMKSDDSKGPTTATIYAEYKNICRDLDLLVLTQRRVRDILVEFASLELVDSHIEFKGRYGRLLHVELTTPPGIIKRILTSDPKFSKYIRI